MSAEPPSPVVLLDLDGTLLDTTYLHVLAWWRALDEAGVGCPMSAIHPLIGMGGDGLTTTLLGAPRPDLAAARRHHFAALHPLVRALPGAGAFVHRIADAGGRPVAASSADAEDLEVLLDALGARGALADVVLAKDAEAAKPDPSIFTAGLKRCGVGPDKALVVGDAVWDVEAARRAGIGCVAVRTGGVDARDLKAAGALAIYDDCAAILADWGASPLGRLLGNG